MLGVIRNAQGEQLDYTFHPGARDDAPLVVIGHGVTAHKDRPFLVALADGLAASGIAALRVSFAGNGASQGRFADSTISKEVEDLGAVLDALPGLTVAYAGHSMGGAVGVLRASRDTRIRCLISLAAMVHTAAFAERSCSSRVPGRDLLLDKPGCVVSQAYLDDLRQIGSVLEQGARITVPWLFVHGAKDELIPLSDTREAFARAQTSKELVVLDEADHSFEPGCTSAMVQAVTRWCLAQFAAIFP